MSEDAQRLELCAEDLRELGASIAGCAFRKTAAHALAPVRAPEDASTSRSGSSTRRTPSRPTPHPPTSLYSLLSASAYAAKTSASNRPDSWLEALGRLVPEMADASEAADRYARLKRRHESLTASVRVLQERVQKQTDEVSLQNRVEEQLATEETVWEQQMQTREQRVAEREVELKALREENASDVLSQHTEDEEEEEEEEDDESRSEAAELKEALALRLEERRDIEAAVESLQVKKRRRASTLASTLDASRGDGEDEADAATAARELVLHELRSEKETLEREILAAEEKQEQQDAHQMDLPALKEEVQAARHERAEMQTQADALRLELARRKRKMKHMVDVQLLTARDTNPPVLREEAVLLHLLDAHEGQMGVSELKQAAREVLVAHSKPHGNGVIIRALYSLVANGVVQIDRSYGDGLVTSLLV